MTKKSFIQIAIIIGILVIAYYYFNQPLFFSQQVNFELVLREMGWPIVLLLTIAALFFKPLRKTIGLLFVILGGLACFTVIGLIIGIPMIMIGGLFLFI